MTEKKLARAKLALLQLASDLNNVSKACKITGYSRQQPPTSPPPAATDR
jgi:hypothetical protein